MNWKGHGRKPLGHNRDIIRILQKYSVWIFLILFNDAFSISRLYRSVGRTIDELERTWKETFGS
jgi:hypothetical protein